MRNQHFFGIGTCIVALACVFVGAVSLLPAQAQVCELPLFIQTGKVDANVVFLFDSSGSMNDAITHDAYDPNVAYTGTLNRTAEYEVASDGWYSRRSFKTGAPLTPTAYLVNSDQGENGVYTGNYLNWVFQYATSTQRAEIPRFTRVQMAKAAVNDIITNMSSNVRYGVYKFNGSTGGLQVAALGTDAATIISNVNSIRATGWTPLGESMVTIAQYFETDTSAIQYDCQRNFVVVVTDGYPTQDVTVPNKYKDASMPVGTCTSIGAPNPDSDECSQYLVHLAKWMRTNDMRTPSSPAGDMPGVQYANTYTVGMNIDAPVLDWAANEGDGAYFVANNAAQLSNSLQNVLRDIVNRISSGAAVAVVSTEGQADDYLYRGKFFPGSWQGYLEAFVLPYETGELPAWEAGDLLSQRSPSSRTIFTSVNGVQQDFTTGNVGNLQSAMGVATSTIATNVINWTRGETVAGYRDRSGWILGDIVESAPVTVGRPNFVYRFNNYAAFRSAYANRERAIYVGSNSGMMHAFLAETGEELWAYIPTEHLSLLDDISATNYCHNFSVNGTPRVTDVYVSGEWKTVLVGGMKQGGNNYFAIDVTDPRNPEFMWENAIPEVNESWSQLEVARVKELDKFVGFVGSGPNDAGDAYFVAFDMEDGAVIEVDLLSSTPGVMNMSTACTAIDLDFDGYDDVMYMSDLAGHLWRYDLTGSTMDKTLLFQTAGQPIQAQPIATVDIDGKVLLYFGTGRYVESDDFQTQEVQSFYCIIDDHGGLEVSRSELVDQTNTINPLDNFKGWFIDLVEAPGERIVEPDALVSGIVYFTSFAPNDAICTTGGQSFLYAVKFRNGAAFDDDDDDSNDGTNGRVTDLGDGIATKPVIDIVNEKILVQGSDTRIHVEDTLGDLRLLTVRSWRQQY
ncbi:MAG: VWA domain-containing protein [Candidatus Latescibacteria bacterium]|nr:VWA domain-containing protein [Candidatus Latescibacterota bacterium]